MSSRVALRKESVDRNLLGVGFRTTLGGSLSARRAWIEIVLRGRFDVCRWVALRKESVDRNLLGGFWCLFGLLSLSARRAWIEMM